MPSVLHALWVCWIPLSQELTVDRVDGQITQSSEPTQRSVSMAVWAKEEGEGRVLWRVEMASQHQDRGAVIAVDDSIARGNENR